MTDFHQYLTIGILTVVVLYLVVDNFRLRRECGRLEAELELSKGEVTRYKRVVGKAAGRIKKSSTPRQHKLA